MVGVCGSAAYRASAGSEAASSTTLLTSRFRCTWALLAPLEGRLEELDWDPLRRGGKSGEIMIRKSMVYLGWLLREVLTWESWCNLIFMERKIEQ